LNHSDFTPLAVVLNESTVFAVKADSPIRSGRDLVQRLQADPAGVSISVGSALGNSNHIAVALIAKSVGVDVKRLKVVPFASAGAGMTALLGGHVDVAVSSLGVFVPQVSAGALRLIAVGGAQRLRGKFADVPTWQENGVKVQFGSWRAMFGARGITADQTRYWEQLLEKTTRTDEWQTMAANRMWEATFKGSQETKSLLDQEYASLRVVLTDLGMAK
jgi:putative tricarboxylic transport membrane protein